MTLDDLSKEPLSEEDIKQFLLTLHNADDRTAAIMGSSFVEYGLKAAIRSRLVDPGETITKTWFDGANAPFATFSAKIKLGQGLGVYGPIMAETLNGIREIRNVFAHRILPLDFSHAAVKEGCWKMAPFMESSLDQDNYKICFITGCVANARALIQYAKLHGETEISVQFP